LIGCAWAAMLAMPFAMLTRSLSGKSLGSYLGLFNCTICLPQIIAALVGGLFLKGFAGKEVIVKKEVLIEGETILQDVPVYEGQIVMLFVAGVALFLAAAAVFLIREKKQEA